MKKTLMVWQKSGFVFTGILGVLLHFLFDWTNQSLSVAVFSAVNESIWEHMKLLFFPMLVFAVLESIFMGRKYESFWCTKLRGIVLGTLLIPALYYTLTGAFGVIPDWVNIAIFFVAAAASFYIEWKLLNFNQPECKYPATAIFFLLLIAVLFAVFTFIPPEIPLFIDSSI